MSNSELMPCPFCGEKPTRERIEPHSHPISFMPDYPGAWIINCDNCEFRLFSHESMSDVEGKWNRRVSQPSEPKGVDVANRKTAFIREGARKIQGGGWSGPRVGGEFVQWYVIGGNGVKFERSPYTDSGWKVEISSTKYIAQGVPEEPVVHEVKNLNDIEALNEFVGVAPYKGWGSHGK